MDSPIKNSPIKNKRIKKYLQAYITVFLVIISFISGFFIGGWQIGKLSPLQAVKQAVYKDRGVNLDLYWEIWDRIHETYLKKPIDDKKLLYGSIAGMVKSLGDPYSTFFDPEEAKLFDEEINGTFEGIGAEIGIKDEQLVIIAPLPDSPAQKGGLLTNDAILAIDQKDTSNLSLEEAVQAIRGEKGSQVTLTITRKSAEKPLEIKITRDTIVVKTVTLESKQTASGKSIAYIKISHFNSDTTTDFLNAVQKILQEGKEGLIIDLRGNPGGYLDTAVKVTSEFLDDEVVVIEEFGDGQRETYNAKGKSRLKNIKTVILVNEGSASAAEIMAGALKDHGKATLVGSKTFGKGSVQDYRQLNDGSSLKLTVAKWLTPNGHSINEEGIEPDVNIPMTEEDYKNNRDPQLDKALEIFQEKN